MNDNHLAPFGAQERAALTALETEPRAAHPAAMDTLGLGVADMLRSKLVDVDDVTIGRVLIALTTGAGFVALALADQEDPGGKRALQGLWAALTGAGLHLAETAWKTGPWRGADREPV
jgi:hypothetical protein